MKKEDLKKKAEELKNKAEGLIAKFKALPKKTQLIAASVSGGIVFAIMILIIVLSCLGNKSINTVKQAVLEYDSSRTIETALSVRCQSLEWSNFQSSDGKNVVEVYGVWKDTECQEAVEKLERRFGVSSNSYQLQSLKRRMLFPGDIIHVQFVLSVDGKQVRLVYGAYMTKNKEIKSFDSALSDTDNNVKMENFLSMMYNGN